MQAAANAGEKPPKDLATLMRRQNNLESTRMMLDSMRRNRSSLSELNDPDARALWVRAYDQANNPRSYPSVTPEGDFGESPLTDAGDPRSITWGSFGEIRKALAALDADDPRAISANLGGNHKVRSFYNNIISPMSAAGDTTIDTHAIAAAHLRPLGASSPMVSAGLGTGGGASSHAGTGSQGLYGLYHEAYRRAAERINAGRQGRAPLLPRQVQSITWEAVRGLFSPEMKRDKAFVAANLAIWNRFRAGRITAEQARAELLAQANGIDKPSWYIAPPTGGGSDDTND